MAVTLQELYLDVRRALRQADIPMPELEARELTAHACGADARDPSGWTRRYAAEEAAQAAHSLCARRVSGEPLAYLLGEWDFCGLTLKVTPDVLIPRADTERLCELATACARTWETPRVLDLCCGSGCIGLAILAAVPSARCISADLSEGALAVTRDNARTLGLSPRSICMRADALAAPHAKLNGFHVMVCNPPYITASEMAELDHSVADYEPHLALYGGTDGLDFYRVLAAHWMEVLVPGGTAFFECGWQQADAVAALLEAAGWAQPEVETDYAGVRRIVIARRPSAENLEQVFENGLQNPVG